MVDALLSPLVDRLLSLAQQQIHDQVSLVVGTKREVESLAITLESLRAAVADAEKRQVMEERVRIWLERLKDIAYQMDDVLDEWSTALLQSQIEGAESSHRKRVSSFLHSPFKRVSRRRYIALKIRDINEQVDHIAKLSNQFNFIPTTNQEPAERLKTVSLVDISSVLGRDHDSDAMLSWLLGQACKHNLGLKTISVVGLGGMGKTTLAQLAFNHHSVKAHFKQRIWVCVSNPFVPSSIFRAILEALGKQSTDFREPEALQREIQENIKGEKFLLVLDDVWNEDYELWEQLERCLQVGDNGSRILVTTRNENVARVMHSIYVHNLVGLPKEQCQELFFQVAFFGKSREKIEELEEIGRKMADKCKGLPLAIKALGTMLQSKNRKEDWENILNSEMWKLDIFEKKVSPGLLLSYYDLPPSLKQCFSYCAVFPKDHDIKIDQLIKLWMAQGYLDSKTDENMEMLGREYFQNLAARSFFQDFEWDEEGNIVKCKMHDIVHDFATYLTHNECLILDDDSENQKINFTIQKGRHATLVVHPLSTFSFSIQNASNLHTLLVVSRIFGHDSLPRSLQEFKYLRAIDLSGNNSIVELPKQVGKLVHLRYLSVSSCKYLVALPESICYLCNLQTLDVSDCAGLHQLPQEISNLINLRHLINAGTDMYNLPIGVARLSFLRTLSTFMIGYGSTVCKLEDLRNLKELTGELEIAGLYMLRNGSEAEKAELKNREKPQRLTLNFSTGESQRAVEMQKDVAEALQPHPNLKSMGLLQYQASEWPQWMMDSSLHQLTKITLSSCGFCQQLPPLGELPHLEILHIYKMPLVKYVGTEFLGSSSSTAVKFPKLKHLTFKDMRKWESWELKEEEEGQAMPCLHSLSLVACPLLKDIPKLELRRTPPSNLKIKYCRILDAMLQDTGRLSTMVRLGYDLIFTRALAWDDSEAIEETSHFPYDPEQEIME